MNVSAHFEDRDLLDLATASSQSDLADRLNQSTPLSWLWALLFGPLYFLAHGFVGRAFVLLALYAVLIGFLVAPFMAYPAWRKRADEEATKMMSSGAIGAY